MKKIVNFFLIIPLFFCLIGCSGGKNKYEASISEYRDALYEGADSDYSVEIIGGNRENPFEIDGVSGSKYNYTLITVTPAKEIGDKALSLHLEMNGEKYEGTALRHPYKTSFSFEIPVCPCGEEITLTLSDGNKESAITAKSVRGENDIGGAKALEIALDQLKEPLSAYCEKDTFVGEIFIRYIKNPLGKDKRYFWYVAFIPKADPDKIIAVLIDPVTGAPQATKVR